MPSVPLLRPRLVVRAFEQHGWQVARQKGSHIVLTKPGSLATLSVPDHPQALIAKAGLTVAEFLAALEN